MPEYKVIAEAEYDTEILQKNLNVETFSVSKNFTWEEGMQKANTPTEGNLGLTEDNTRHK